MEFIKRFAEHNISTYPRREIKYIVIHYTAGTTSRKGTAIGIAEWFGKPEAKSSADFVVDDELIVQLNANIRNQYCWAVGGNHYGNKGGRLYGVAKNSNCISIEICSTNDTGRVTTPNDSHWSFTDKVIERAVELTRYLMKEYNIPAQNVIRHYDVNGKPCPGIIGWNADSGSEKAWNDFISRISDKPKYKPHTWYKSDEMWWYADSETTWLHDTWADINHHRYYFDSDGYAVVGWHTIDEKLYFFEDEPGHPLECALYVTDENGVQTHKVV